MEREITAQVGAPRPIVPAPTMYALRMFSAGNGGWGIYWAGATKERIEEKQRDFPGSSIITIPGDAEAKGQPAPAPSAGLREEAEKAADEAMQLWEKEPDDVSLAPFIADALLAFAAAHPPVVRLPGDKPPTSLFGDGWNRCLKQLKALNPHASFEEAKS